MERTNLIFSIINTTILLIGGILGYFLVTQEQLREVQSNIALGTSEVALNKAELEILASEKILKQIRAELAPIDEVLKIAKTNGEVILNLSQTKLNEINREIARLELDLKQTNLQLDKLSKRTNVTLDVSSLINDIQPSLKISCKDAVKQPVYEINCSYDNLGTHKARLSAPIVKVYRKHQRTPIDGSNFKISGLVGNTIVSGGFGSDKYYITDLNNVLSNDFIIEIKWSASLHPSVKSAVSPLLTEVISPELINVLTEMNYSFRLNY